MARSCRIAALAFLACLVSQSVSASPITIGFTGQVTNDPFGVFDSATFAGIYTYDSNTTQVLSTTNSGGYEGSGGIFSMSVQFTGTVGGTLDGVLFSADTVNITINNDFPGPLDQYLVTGTSTTDSLLSIGLRLEDFTGLVFGSTALPTTAPNPASFDLLTFALFAGTVDDPIEAEGELSSLVCVSGCTVPEPATTTLLAVALGVWAYRRRTVS